MRVAYDLYQHPENSLTDIIRYMTENGINASRPTPRTKNGISNLDRSHLSRILENPLYVRADKEVYAYFSSKGYEMLDDIEAYDRKPDTETESIKTEIIRIDGEIQKLMEKLADADSVLFDYIQKRVSALHEQKSELDKKMQTMCRKRKAIDTKPLEEPMKQWDKLTVQEKHDVAAAMIDVVLVSDETGIEVKFSI